MISTDALAAALAGRYTIDRLVGEGGMAKVYLARDLRHNRQVALKVLRPDLGASTAFKPRSRSLRTCSIRTCSRCSIPGAAGDLLFYVMPFVGADVTRGEQNADQR